MIQCAFCTQETPMPTFREYLLKTKKAYDNNQFVNALACLDSIEQDNAFTHAEKLEACKLRTGILVKQKHLAKTHKKKLELEIALTEAFMRQDWYALLTSSETITHYQPDLSSQLFMAGERYSSEGKITEALSTYQAALTLNPHHWQAAQQCIRIYFEMAQYEAMTPLCEVIIANISLDTPLHSNICFHAHYYLATAYLLKKMMGPAMRHLLKAEDITPGTVEVMLKFGEVAKNHMYAHHQTYTLNTQSILNADLQPLTLLRDDFASQSIRCFESALNLQPENIEAHEALAEIYFYRHNFDKATQHFTCLLQLNEKNAIHYQYKMAQMMVENKEYATALRQLNNIVCRPDFKQIPSPLQSDLYFTCGFIHEKMQDYNQAIKQYNLALTINFRNMAACFASERLFKSKLIQPINATLTFPTPEKALPIFSLILNAPHCSPASKAYLIGLCAHVYAKLKNIELALTCYQWADTISPNGPVEQAAIVQLSKLKEMRNTQASLVQLSLFQGTEQSPEIITSQDHALGTPASCL